MPPQAVIDSSVRGPYDALATPQKAVGWMSYFLPSDVILWESAYGTGLLADHFRKLGWRVVGDPSLDYFNDAPPRIWDIQITNPPFSLKQRWLERATLLAKPWALLLPITTLGRRDCHPYLRECEIIFLPRRIDFTGKGAPWFSVAWFTSGLNLGKQLIFPESNRHGTHTQSPPE